MKKILFVFSLFLIFSVMPVCAEDVQNTPKTGEIVHTDSQEILTKIKYYKNSIYSSLDLSSQQKEQISQLDEKLYKDIEPSLVKVAVLSNNLIDLANSGNCTKKAVNKVKKDFQPISNEMYSVRKVYEKELFSVLTKEQKTQYRVAKKQQRKEFRKEIEEQRQLHIKNQNKTQS